MIFARAWKLSRMASLTAALLTACGCVAAQTAPGQKAKDPAAAKTAVPPSVRPDTPTPSEPNESRLALAERFHANKNGQVDAAASAAREYLQSAPRSPRDAAEMRAWLSAYERVAQGERAEDASSADDASLPLEQLKRSLRDALLGHSIGYKITDLTVIPDNIVPVSMSFETVRLEYSSVEFQGRCLLDVKGQETASFAIVDEDGGTGAPDVRTSDTSLTWELDSLDPHSLKIVSGSEIGAREPVAGLAYFARRQGGRSARVPSPEYFVVIATKRSDAGSALDFGELVFVDESHARNVANALVRAITLCHRIKESPPVAAPAKRSTSILAVALAMTSDSGSSAGRVVPQPPVAIPGDRWVYEVRFTRMDGNPGTYEKTLEVVEARAGEIKVLEEQRADQWSSHTTLTLTPEWNETVRVTEFGSSRSTTTHAPSSSDLAYPLVPGKRWEHGFRASDKSDSFSSWSDTVVKAEVVGWEQVSVPAGTFTGIRIRYATSSRNSHSGEVTGSSVRWYVPDMKSFVRAEHKSHMADGKIHESVTELVRFTPGR